ncbi:UNVERIFIED_CONTAM: hypothetical protein K2H54_016429 [Gekko kuhli]
MDNGVGSDSQHLPRLCCPEKGPNGYGFHLHGEKGKVGQFIRLVEPDSPAEKSGLRAGDRLVEVNGENVEKESHQQVVNRIRNSPGSVRLLVVDAATDERLQKLGLECSEELVHALPAEQAEGQSGDQQPREAAPPQEPEQRDEEEKDHVDQRLRRARFCPARTGPPAREAAGGRCELICLSAAPLLYLHGLGFEEILIREDPGGLEMPMWLFIALGLGLESNPAESRAMWLRRADLARSSGR